MNLKTEKSECQVTLDFHLPLRATSCSFETKINGPQSEQCLGTSNLMSLPQLFFLFSIFVASIHYKHPKYFREFNHGHCLIPNFFAHDPISCTKM